MALTFCDDLNSAKEKWCPMAHNGSDQKCLADGCMAWRWIETNIKDEDGHLEPTYDTHGYCGLAENKEIKQCV